jgi:hypothetical protein
MNILESVLPWRLAVHATDPQLLTHHAHFLQVAKDIPRHSLGQIDKAVIVTDIDVPDVTPLEAGLVGDRADDVAGLHAVAVAYFETEGFENNIVALVTLAASRPRTVVAWRAQRAIALAVTLDPTVTLSITLTLGRPVALSTMLTLGPAMSLSATVASGPTVILTATAILAAMVTLRTAGTAVARGAVAACTIAIAGAAIIRKLPQAIAAVIASLRRTVARAVADNALLTASSTNVVGLRLAIANFTLIAANNKRTILIAGNVMFHELHWAVSRVLCITLQRELISFAVVGCADLLDFTAYARLPERTVHRATPRLDPAHRSARQGALHQPGGAHGQLDPAHSFGRRDVRRGGRRAPHRRDLVPPPAQSAAHRLRVDATHWPDPPTAVAAHRPRYRTAAHSWTDCLDPRERHYGHSAHRGLRHDHGRRYGHWAHRSYHREHRVDHAARRCGPDPDRAGHLADPNRALTALIPISQAATKASNLAEDSPGLLRHQ